MEINIAVKKLFISSLFIFTFQFYLFSQEIKINQKHGFLQKKLETHVTFHEFKKFQPDVNKVTLREITRLIIHDNKVFILDKRQSRIFVCDKEANYLYTIGRPGQGPGDLEYPCDFFINSEGTVYVLSSAAFRVEVFSREGNFIKRINLAVPKDISYSHPNLLCLDQDHRQFIGYDVSSHLIDEYQDNGSFVRTLIKRDDPIRIPGVNIGNCSSFHLLKQNQDITYFNYFSGIFIILSRSGTIKAKFSAYDSLHQNKMSKILVDIKKSNSPMLSINEFELWSPFFCIDDQGLILSMLLLKRKKEPQKFFVFSKDGKYLYHMAIPFFENDIVDQMYFYDNIYIFITRDQNIFFSK
jgi:hypothetical protein